MVDERQHLSGRSARKSLVLQKGLGDDHEQRSRHSLAGYIGDCESQMVLVHKIKIVEVSADLLGGSHAGIQIDLQTVRKRRKDTGKHVMLDPGSDIKLRSDPLLLGSDTLKILRIGIDLPDHVDTGPCQIADFSISVAVRPALLLNLFGIESVFLLTRIVCQHLREMDDRSGHLLLNGPHEQNLHEQKDVQHHCDHYTEPVPEGVIPLDHILCIGRPFCHIHFHHPVIAVKQFRLHLQ